jgi:hypothetical protein
MRKVARAALLVVAGALSLACGGRARHDDMMGGQPEGGGEAAGAGTGGQSSGGSQAVGTGGTAAATCTPGEESACVCRTGAMGTSLCKPDGQSELCQCPDVIDNGGLPAGCEIGVECSSCGTCLSKCVCNTSNYEQCLSICSECSGGHVGDPNSCSSSGCDFTLPWANACFDDEEQACRCACDGGSGGGCMIDGGTCPPTVVCVI